jgi:HEAT repeats
VFLPCSSVAASPGAVFPWHTDAEMIKRAICCREIHGDYSSEDPSANRSWLLGERPLRNDRVKVQKIIKSPNGKMASQMVKDMSHELLRLIVEAEDDDDELLDLSQLKDFGSNFISGLIDCLADSDWLIRKHAIQILGSSRPESDRAVPALIACLDDENEAVKETALAILPYFGPLAVDAIPYLDPWYQIEDECMAIKASIMIAKLDPTRVDAMIRVRDAINTNSTEARDLALKFLSERRESLPFDEQNFKTAVRSGWEYLAPSQQVDWSCRCRDEVWYIDLAPVFQLVLGQVKKERIWAHYRFDIAAFSNQPGVLVDSVETRKNGQPGRIATCTTVAGQYFGETFVLNLYSRPFEESEARESVNILTMEIAPIDTVKDDAEDDEGLNSFGWGMRTD